MLALENIDVLRQNGFEIDVDDSPVEGDSHRLRLLSIPVSKSTVFDIKGKDYGGRDLCTRFLKIFNIDLEEILYLLHDRPKGQMVRSSRARSMFASRACRKSVMIGMPLTQSQMKTVSAETLPKEVGLRH